MKTTDIHIPELSLVVLVGTSGSGKSTFAKKHFLGTEVISSDYCRGLVSDNENSLEATSDAFDLVHYMIEKRLKRGNLTVVDATNLRPEDRKKLIQLARKYHVFAIAIVLNLDKKIAYERNALRPERATMGKHVIRNHFNTLQRHVKKLKKEGFRKVFEFKDVETINTINIQREKLWNNKKELQGPFDIIGDVHGCFTELRELLTKLGYDITKHRDRTKNYGYTIKNPKGRTTVFVGDLVDRGPASNEVLRLVMSMVKNNQALCVAGNHDDKLKRKLEGRNVQIKHGLAETLEQLASEPASFIDEAKEFLDGLISHYMLDGGKLCVAHAGLREDMQGRTSGPARAFALYGDTTGEIDTFGLPVRYNWAQDYNGKALVVYGHTPVKQATWLNNTVDIDTGCVFGGTLTALRYPERTMVTIQAKKEYAIARKPIEATTEEETKLLDIADVLGKQHITTPLGNTISIREENAAAALEVISRFAVDPKWLIYLPPTMSPSATSFKEDYLEHPEEAFEYYQKAGIQQVVCQEKHMGSRAVITVGKNEVAITNKFDIKNGGLGKIITRTGRSFFEDDILEQALLKRISEALTKANFWNNHDTDWVVLDVELMPWSAKAMKLIETQYAAVGNAATIALNGTAELLSKAQEQHSELKAVNDRYQEKSQLTRQFKKAYREYCWDVKSIEDYKIAPFHILATEGQTYTNKDHVWHMETIASFAKFDAILMATTYKIVDFTQPESITAATNWWLERTANGSEGMVVKPMQFITQTDKGTIQPAIKCRGKEYLRIIYGPDYTQPENLNNLRKRSLNKKRNLALKEFALGIEALDRFTNKDAMRKVHQCVFGILALESDPVDPRL